MGLASNGGRYWRFEVHTRPRCTPRYIRSVTAAGPIKQITGRSASQSSELVIEFSPRSFLPGYFWTKSEQDLRSTARCLDLMRTGSRRAPDERFSFCGVNPVSVIMTLKAQKRPVGTRSRQGSPGGTSSRRQVEEEEDVTVNKQEPGSAFQLWTTDK